MSASPEREEFFNDCVEHFAEAILALTEFRREMQRRFRSAVGKRDADLARVLGSTKAEIDVWDYVWPDNPLRDDLDPREVWVGVKVRCPGREAAFFIYWELRPEEAERPIGVSSYIWVKDPDLKTALHPALEKAGDVSMWRTQIFKHTYRLSHPMELQEASKLDRHIKALVDYVIDLLDRAGTLKIQTAAATAGEE
ncbi:MAG: hypothetical protein ACM336_04680 [Acidobacteriota bacterium]